MKNILYILGSICLLFLLYGNTAKKNKKYAEVIAFHSEKCLCCWGWDIKVDNNIIRSVPVYIQLGKKTEPCSSRLTDIDFYQVLKIKK